MESYAAYAIGAALVDTEIQVTDNDLVAMNVDKGMMTLMDQSQQTHMLSQLTEHLIQASHASGAALATA